MCIHKDILEVGVFIRFRKSTCWIRGERRRV